MSKVKFNNSGEDAEVKPGDSLMEVTKDNGWPIAYGCEDGMCGTCIVRVKEGKENLNEVEEHEKQTLDIMGLDDGDHRLACQCKIEKEGDIEIEQ